MNWIIASKKINPKIMRQAVFKELMFLSLAT
jgi:hypothetical protein